MVVLGSVSPMTPQPEQEAEFKKTITSMLVQMPVFIIFDNMTGTLKSDMLAMMLTTDVWGDRELGTNRMIQVPIKAIPIGTANNLQIGGDLPRRLVWARLDARMERPDERQPEKFNHPDVPAWGLEHRGELIHAALVLIQAWISRGKRPGSQTMGSYETWACTMGGILDVAGVPGFLSNAAVKRNGADEEAAHWRAFCRSWWNEHAAEPVGVKELFVLAQAEDMLPWVMVAETEPGQRRKLGNALPKMVGRYFGQFRIVDAERETRGGTRQYQLERKPEDSDEDGERERAGDDQRGHQPDGADDRPARRRDAGQPKGGIFTGEHDAAMRAISDKFTAKNQDLKDRVAFGIITPEQAEARRAILHAELDREWKACQEKYWDALDTEHSGETEAVHSIEGNDFEDIMEA
jgi:hypothetical protein